MELVKKNILSILCGVVALVAVVVVFWPASGMYSELQGQVDKSKSTYNEIESLRKAERKLPSLVLESGEAQQRILPRFPNEKVNEFGKTKTLALTAQSKAMLAKVTELNVHKLLVEGSLPRPLGRAPLDFVVEYRAAMGLSDDEGWKVGLPALLNATRPPLDDELKDIAEEIWLQKYNVRVITIGGKDNMDVLTQEFQSEVGDLAERERKKRALEHKIYLDDDSFAISRAIESGKPPTPADMWYAQMVFWIEKDVCDAINNANKKATNVLDAPVKHLVYVNAPFDRNMYVLGTTAGMVPAPDGTMPAIPVNANGVPELFSASPTGRVCGDLYDVVHFDMGLRVDYRKIPEILAELERDRLFTVLSTSVTAVNASEERTKNGYFYGDAPIVSLTLTCEALFLRSWTVDKENSFHAALMPDLVMQDVGAKPGPGSFGTGTGTGSGGNPAGEMGPNGRPLIEEGI